MKILRFISASLCLIVSTAGAQKQDSLLGFDEVAAYKSTLAENFIGPEIDIHMNQLKRKYINDKFGIAPQKIEYQFLQQNRSALAGCDNEDFESSSAGAITSSTQISGWTLIRGMNTNGSTGCNLSGCCPSNPNESSIITAANGYTDPIIGSIYPIYSVFGSVSGNTNAAVANPHISFNMMGNNFIRLNSNTANYSIERLAKTFTVSASNALFKFAFISVQASGHSCCDAGGFILKITNVSTNTFLSALSYSASGFSSSCTSTTGVNYLSAGTGTPAGANTTLNFNKWHVNYADFSAYIGQVIQVEVISCDCTAGGHFAYSYFDSECGPLDLSVNSTPNNISCFSTATVSGPSNLNSYNWSGPNNFTSSANSFTTNVAGVYTLSIPQNPPYLSIEKTLSLIISPASVTLTANHETICKGEKVILSGDGLVNYTWSGGGSSSTKTVQPNATTSYTLTGSNSNSCPGFAVITITVNACTGVGMESASNFFKIFPNPNNGEFLLMVEKELQKGEIIIVNNLGQLVHAQKISSGENKIMVHDLPAGIYYYSLLSGEEPISQGKLTIKSFN